MAPRGRGSSAGGAGGGARRGGGGRGGSGVTLATAWVTVQSDTSKLAPGVKKAAEAAGQQIQRNISGSMQKAFKQSETYSNGWAKAAGAQSASVKRAMDGVVQSTQNVGIAYDKLNKIVSNNKSTTAQVKAGWAAVTKAQKTHENSIETLGLKLAAFNDKQKKYNADQVAGAKKTANEQDKIWSRNAAAAKRYTDQQKAQIERGQAWMQREIENEARARNKAFDRKASAEAREDRKQQTKAEKTAREQRTRSEREAREQQRLFERNRREQTRARERSDREYTRNQERESRNAKKEAAAKVRDSERAAREEKRTWERNLTAATRYQNTQSRRNAALRNRSEREMEAAAHRQNKLFDQQAYRSSPAGQAKAFAQAHQRMRDELSGTAAHGERSWQRMSARMALNNMSTASSFRNHMSSAINDMVQSAGYGMRSARTGIMKSMGAPMSVAGAAGLGMAGAAGITATINRAISGGMQRIQTIQNAQVAMEMVMGDKGKANDLVNKTVSLAQGTPYGADTFLQMARNMVTMGVKQEQIVPAIEALANSAAVMGKPASALDQLSREFGKIQAEGRIMGRDVYELQRVGGINARAIIASHMGMTPEELTKQMGKKGGLNVPAEEIIQVLTEGIMKGSSGTGGNTPGYAGGLEVMRHTLSGAISVMKSQMDRLGAAFLGGADINNPKGFMAMFPRMLDSITHGAGGLDEMSKAGGPIDRFQQKLSDAGFFKALETGFSKIPGMISGAFSGMDKVMEGLQSPGAKNFFHIVGDDLHSIWQSIKNLAPSIGGVAASLGQGFAGTGLIGLTLFKDAVTTIAPAIKGIADVVASSQGAVQLGIGLWATMALRAKAATIASGIAAKTLGFMSQTAYDSKTGLATTSTFWTRMGAAYRSGKGNVEGMSASLKTIPSVIATGTGAFKLARTEGMNMLWATRTGISGMASHATNVHTNFVSTMRGTMSAAMSGMRDAGRSLAGAFGGPWGLAIAGAATVIGLLAMKHGEAAAKAREQKEEEQQLTTAIQGTLDATTGKVTEETRQEAGKIFGKKDQYGHSMFDRAQSYGINLPSLIDAGTGTGDPGAYTRIRDKAGKQLQGVQGRVRNAQFSDFMRDSGLTQEELTAALLHEGNAWDTVSAKIEAYKNKKNEAAGEDLHMSLGLQQFIDGMGDSDQSIVRMIQELNKFITSNEHGADAARALQQALNGTWEATDEARNRFANLGATIIGVPNGKEIDIKVDPARYFATKAALESLGYTVQKLPDGTVKVTADSDQALQRIAELVKRIDTTEATLHVRLDTDKFNEDVKAWIAKVQAGQNPGPLPTAPLPLVPPGAPPGASGPMPQPGPPRAKGGKMFSSGKLWGPGTGTSDSMTAYLPDGSPIRVSDGESVNTRKSTVENWPWIDAMNQGLRLPAFDEGGWIGRGRKYGPYKMTDEELGVPPVPSPPRITDFVPGPPSSGPPLLPTMADFMPGTNPIPGGYQVQPVVPTGPLTAINNVLADPGRLLRSAPGIISNMTPQDLVQMNAGLPGTLASLWHSGNVINNWGQHSGFDQTMAVVDFAGLLPIPGLGAIGRGASAVGRGAGRGLGAAGRGIRSGYGALERYAASHPPVMGSGLGGLGGGRSGPSLTRAIPLQPKFGPPEPPIPGVSAGAERNYRKLARTPSSLDQAHAHIPPEILNHYREIQRGGEHVSNLETLISQQGIRTPLRLVVSDTHGLMLEGNNRLQAALNLGLDTVPVQFIKNLNELDWARFSRSPMAHHPDVLALIQQHFGQRALPVGRSSKPRSASKVFVPQTLRDQATRMGKPAFGSELHPVMDDNWLNAESFQTSIPFMRRAAAEWSQHTHGMGFTDERADEIAEGISELWATRPITRETAANLGRAGREWMARIAAAGPRNKPMWRGAELQPAALRAITKPGNMIDMPLSSFSSNRAIAMGYSKHPETAAASLTAEELAAYGITPPKRPGTPVLLQVQRGAHAASVRESPEYNEMFQDQLHELVTAGRFRVVRVIEGNPGQGIPMRIILKHQELEHSFKPFNQASTPRMPAKYRIKTPVSIPGNIAEPTHLPPLMDYDTDALNELWDNQLTFPFTKDPLRIGAREAATQGYSGIRNPAQAVNAIDRLQQLIQFGDGTVSAQADAALRKLGGQFTSRAAHSPSTASTSWRGMPLSDKWKFQPGQQFSMPLSSFTTRPELAASYAMNPEAHTGQAMDLAGMVPTVFALEPGAQGVSLDRIPQFEEFGRVFGRPTERLHMGDFEVTRVRPGNLFEPTRVFIRHRSLIESSPSLEQLFAPPGFRKGGIPGFSGGGMPTGNVDWRGKEYETGPKGGPGSPAIPGEWGPNTKWDPNLMWPRDDAGWLTQHPYPGWPNRPPWKPFDPWYEHRGHVGMFSHGGNARRITGAGTGTSDSIAGLVDGVDPILVSNGESINTAISTRDNWPIIHAMNKGLRLPGLLKRMGVPGFAGGSDGIARDTAGTGSPQVGGMPGIDSGAGMDLVGWLTRVVEWYNQANGTALAITADFPGGPHGHPDDGGQHSVGRAVDIGGPSDQMAGFSAWWTSNPQLVAITRQLIHNNPAFPSSKNVIGGQFTEGSQTYANAPWGGHSDHIHLAVQSGPGGDTSMLGNGGGRGRGSSPSHIRGLENQLETADNQLSNAEHDIEIANQHLQDLKNRKTPPPPAEQERAEETLRRATARRDEASQHKTRLQSELSMAQAGAGSGGSGGNGQGDDTTGKTMGKMFVDGVMESFGFDGSVFSDPRQWTGVKSIMALMSWFMKPSGGGDADGGLGIPGMSGGKTAGLGMNFPAGATGRDAIIQQVLSAGMSQGASTNMLKASLMAGLAESGFDPRATNGNHKGIFQMDDAKGTEEQRRDPAFAADWWWRTAMAVPGHDSMDPTALAEAVERSGKPGAYTAKSEEAQGILNNMMGLLGGTTHGANPTGPGPGRYGSPAARPNTGDPYNAAPPGGGGGNFGGALSGVLGAFGLNNLPGLVNGGSPAGSPSLLPTMDPSDPYYSPSPSPALSPNNMTYDDGGDDYGDDGGAEYSPSAYTSGMAAGGGGASAQNVGNVTFNLERGATLGWDPRATRDQFQRESNIQTNRYQNRSVVLT